MVEITVPLLSLVSVVLTGAVISNAFYQHNQFYPSVVYLTKSNASMAVIYFQGFVFVMLLWTVIRRVFFGSLRALENEHLMERSWHAVIETCLAFTVFRDDFSPRFVAMFTLLLMIKCLHWLAEDRVDYMERSPIITMLFHIRMMALLALLSSIDSFFVSHAYFTTLLRGASVQLVFGFEYAILMTAVFMVSIKYTLHTIDLRSAHPWENKAVYLLYAELVLSIIRAGLYMVFVVVMIKLHTFPLFMIRPMYLTIRTLKKTLTDIMKSRRAIRNLNTLYPNATEEELQGGEIVCIICREEMRSAAKKLPCNHIFHTACLRSWFQRQQTCPTCRMDILAIDSAGRAGAAAAARNAALPGAGPPLPGGQVPPPAAGAPTPGPSGGRGASPSVANGTIPGTSAAPGATSSPLPPSFTPAMLGFPLPQPSTSQQPGVAGVPPLPFGNTTLPSFGMMPPPMPFLLPFPNAPNFAGLSDEDVAAMEGTERQAVEARINCLRNIQTLMDAASVQLQQYLSILSTLSASPQFSAPITVTPSRPAEEATTSSVKDKSDTNGVISDQEKPSTSKDPITPKTTSAATDNVKFSLGTPSTAETSQNKSENPDDESSEEQQALRNRRLQHFDSFTKSTPGAADTTD